MKDRKTRVILILIACCLAAIVLIIWKPPLRSLIFWAEERRYFSAMQSLDNEGSHGYFVGPDALLPAKEPTAVILAHPALGNSVQILPSLARGTITDPAEVAALVQTIRDGAVEHTELLRSYEGYEGTELELTFVSADGECWSLTLWQEGDRNKPDNVSYALRLPFPDDSYCRITDECAQAILALFERYPERDFTDPATYAAVRVEELSSGEAVELSEAEILSLAEMLLSIPRNTSFVYNPTLMPMQPDYAIRFRFTDGGEHYLGYSFTAGVCRLFPVVQVWDYDWDTRTYWLTNFDLFEGAVTAPPGKPLYSISRINDVVTPFLQQFFPEVEP